MWVCNVDNEVNFAHIKQAKIMKTELQLKIINIIRDFRNDNDLSQAGLADILETSYGLIGNIESPKFSQKYTISQLYKLATYFEIQFEVLFLTEDEANMNKRNVIDLLINKIAEYDREAKNY